MPSVGVVPQRAEAISIAKNAFPESDVLRVFIRFTASNQVVALTMQHVTPMIRGGYKLDFDLWTVGRCQSCHGGPRNVLSDPLLKWTWCLYL